VSLPNSVRAAPQAHPLEGIGFLTCISAFYAQNILKWEIRSYLWRYRYGNSAFHDTFLLSCCKVVIAGRGYYNPSSLTKAISCWNEISIVSVKWDIRGRRSSTLMREHDREVRHTCVSRNVSVLAFLPEKIDEERIATMLSTLLLTLFSLLAPLISLVPGLSALPGLFLI